MLDKLTRWLFIIILIELVLGGGGRLIAVGPISLRMVLFLLAIIITGLHLLKGNKVNTKHVYLLFVFTGMLAIGTTVGLITGADKKLIWEDMKPLMFFYLLPFFGLAIKNENDTAEISKIISVSGLVMAFAFLFVLLALFTNAIKFIDFYNLADPFGEFFFRGEYSFFYKGFIYLCIGFLFVHLSYKKNRWWLLIVLLTAIILTFTRGLILAISLCYVVYYLFIKRFYVRTIIACLACGLILFYAKTIYVTISEKLYVSNSNTSTPSNYSDKLLGDREYSDNVRILQIKEVAFATTISSFVWGHGFGNGVASRPVHMEISYLEIFHKQGAIGIACWAIILLALIASYKNLSPLKSDLGDAYLLAALFVFFQSLTNQYINNPIGLGMILLSLVSLDVLSKKQ